MTARKKKIFGKTWGSLDKTLSFTARLIASLGSRFPPFTSASSQTSLCGFMLLSGDNLRRAQPIPFYRHRGA
jgi:hypothetical protein